MPLFTDTSVLLMFHVLDRRAQKVRFAMTFRTSLPAVSLGALLGLSSVLHAQRTNTPDLNEILERLDANLNHYDKGVPSFFCDEHVISKVEPGLPSDNSATDSIFRVRRTASPDHTTALTESRDIKTVNGRPATKKDIAGPTLLDGAFEGGLAVVSLNQTACMNYTLQRAKGKSPNEPYIVRFATVLTPQNTANCLLQEKSSGSVTIDPVSMQITHVEITTPRHIIIHGNPYTSPVIGRRLLTADYAPVALGSETFWMPTTITMRAISGSGTFHPEVWSFVASYSNYHKLEVTSRILPPGETPRP